jgi:DNA repair exonuclease SbcCD ATPase subunit
MWTGRQTLSSIEGAIANLRREEGQLDAALRSAAEQAERLRKERGEALRELARIKLDEIAAGRLVHSLDAGERRAAQILEDNRLRLAALAERREGLVAEVASAEAQRNGAAAAVEAALEALEAVRSQATSSASARPDWQAAKEALASAEAIATEAEKKAASSEAELGAKRKPYDDDPLFTYLWGCKFGTADYRAGNFAHMIDRMVADFIGFGDVRPNYAALIEIPLRLREHATAKRAEAALRAEALLDVERSALVEAGIGPREQTLSEARHKMAAADQALEDKNGLLRKLEDERKNLVATGTDPSYTHALETIASADSKDDLAALYQEARRTPTGSDDAMVRKLESIDQGITKADAEIAELRRTAQELARRRAEVQQVRDRFRNAGYDHPYGGFDNDNAISDGLKQVLAGAAGSILWELLRGGYSNRGPRGGRDGGMSPFPFPIPGRDEGRDRGWSGGGWREPSSRGDWSPGEDSSPGGSRDDDDRFTTGGSF